VIRAEALLPHESICRTCSGERKVLVSENRYSTTATEPRTYEAVCDRCDGTGIEVNERRENSTLRAVIEACHRQEIIDHLREAERSEIALVATINEKDRTITAQQDHIDALLIENRRYRDAIDKAAAVIVRNARRGMRAVR
jgi:hypothetical protein